MKKRWLFWLFPIGLLGALPWLVGLAAGGAVQRWTEATPAVALEDWETGYRASTAQLMLGSRRLELQVRHGPYLMPPNWLEARSRDGAAHLAVGLLGKLTLVLDEPALRLTSTPPFEAGSWWARARAASEDVEWSGRWARIAEDEWAITGTGRGATHDLQLQAETRALHAELAVSGQANGTDIDLQFSRVPTAAVSALLEGGGLMALVPLLGSQPRLDISRLQRGDQLRVSGWLALTPVSIMDALAEPSAVIRALQGEVYVDATPAALLDAMNEMGADPRALTQAVSAGILQGQDRLRGRLRLADGNIHGQNGRLPLETLLPR